MWWGLCGIRIFGLGGYVAKGAYAYMGGLMMWWNLAHAVV